MAAQTFAPRTHELQSLPRERMIELVEGLGAAKSAQDVELAMTFQHPEMELRTPAFNSHAIGHAANAKTLAGFFKWFPDYSVDLKGYANDHNSLTAWAIIRMTWTGDHLGVTPNGEQAAIPVMMQFTFRDDLIASELFFFDLADLCAQSGVSVDAVHDRFFPKTHPC